MSAGREECQLVWGYQKAAVYAKVNNLQLKLQTNKEGGKDYICLTAVFTAGKAGE